MKSLTAWGLMMAVMTIRNLDEALKMRLRIRAAYHGRSMEEEARDILRSVLSGSEAPVRDPGQAIHQRFARLEGVDLVLPPRAAIREVDFGA